MRRAGTARRRSTSRPCTPWLRARRSSTSAPPTALSGLDDAWACAIDNHVADVITNSWTDGTDDISLLGQAYVDFYKQFSLEAALTGHHRQLLLRGRRRPHRRRHRPVGEDRRVPGRPPLRHRRRRHERPDRQPRPVAERVRLADRVLATLTDGGMAPPAPVHTARAAAAAPACCSRSRSTRRARCPRASREFYGSSADAGRARHLHAGRPEHRASRSARPRCSRTGRTGISTGSAAPACRRRCWPEWWRSRTSTPTTSSGSSTRCTTTCWDACAA